MKAKMYIRAGAAIWNLGAPVRPVCIAIVHYLSANKIAIVEIESLLHYKVLKQSSFHPKAPKCIVK